MGQLFKTVVDVSVSAGALCVLILLARPVIGRRPTALLPLLGALLIVRLAVPVMIPSSLSVFNIFGGVKFIQAEAPAASLPDVSYYSEPALNDGAPQPAANAGGADIAVDTWTENADAENVKPAAPPLSGMDVASIVWLAGIAALSACIVFSNIRFSRQLKKNRPYGAPGFDGLLAQCKNELRINKRICAVQMSGINTAAVYGVMKPRLLVSPSFELLSDEEKRHVLLHELAHIKRRDTLVCLLITILNVVHWFNPLVWAALSLLRGDMEVMCDVAVLKRTDDRKGYAATLLRLAEAESGPRPRLVTALFMRRSLNGLFISTDGIKRRMNMIKRYKKNSALFMCLALILVAAVAVVGCTSPAAETASPQSPVSAAAVPPEIKGAAANPSAAPPADALASGTGAEELVAAYYLDISSLPEDAARTYNIEKAIKLLDGTVFPAWDKTKPDDPDWWIDVLFELRQQSSITEGNGWKTAPAAGADAAGKAESWILLNDTENGRFINKDPDAFENDIAKANTSAMLTGGGIDMVMIAIRKAVTAAGMDNSGFAPIVVTVNNPDGTEGGSAVFVNGTTNMASGTGEVKSYIISTENTDGWFEYFWDVGAGNNRAEDLTLKLSMQDNAIVAAFYAPKG